MTLSPRGERWVGQELDVPRGLCEVAEAVASARSRRVDTRVSETVLGESATAKGMLLIPHSTRRRGDDRDSLDSAHWAQTSRSRQCRMLKLHGKAVSLSLSRTQARKEGRGGRAALPVVDAEGSGEEGHPASANEGDDCGRSGPAGSARICVRGTGSARGWLTGRAGDGGVAGEMTTRAGRGSELGCLRTGALGRVQGLAATVECFFAASQGAGNGPREAGEAGPTRRGGAQG